MEDARKKEHEEFGSAGNSKKSENGGKDVTNEAEEQMSMESEMENQTNHEVDRSTVEQIINTQSESDETKENTIENGVEGGKPIKPDPDRHDRGGETAQTIFPEPTLPSTGEGDNGTIEDEAAFRRELESFYREKAMDFKPPKFYGKPLNCLKLWRAVFNLGGYDRVTEFKLWRQVGESFNPPKTCTTVSWTFRIFYEKSLLEYERHKAQVGELQFPAPTLLEASGVDTKEKAYEGRAKRDAAARAMQGWHVQRLLGDGEISDPVIKDNNMSKRDKNIKSIGSIKQKRRNEVKHSAKAARTETLRQVMTSIVDIGPPADWVKINVRQTKNCFEVYALVPGLLREEVRVESDPVGLLVITGHSQQVNNPWGITPFKKVVRLPARIDPFQSSAVLSLHGRLFVRVPFE